MTTLQMLKPVAYRYSSLVDGCVKVVLNKPHSAISANLECLYTPDQMQACWAEALEEAAKVCEEGTTTMQRDGINDGKPWQTRNDPNGYCTKAIIGLK